MLIHSHNVEFVLFIFLHQEFQKFCLLLCELMVNLGVSVNLNRHIQSGLVIFTADHLCKATFAKNFQDFKSVVELITSLNNIIAFFVITFCLAFCFTTNSSLGYIPCEVDNIFALLA